MVKLPFLFLTHKLSNLYKRYSIIYFKNLKNNNISLDGEKNEVRYSTVWWNEQTNGPR